MAYWSWKRALADVVVHSRRIGRPLAVPESLELTHAVVSRAQQRNDDDGRYCGSAWLTGFQSTPSSSPVVRLGRCTVSGATKWRPIVGPRYGEDQNMDGFPYRVGVGVEPAGAVGAGVGVARRPFPPAKQPFSQSHQGLPSMAVNLSSVLPGPAVGTGVGVAPGGTGVGVPAGAVGAGVGVPSPAGAAQAGSPLSTLYSRVNVRLYGTQPVKLFLWSHSPVQRQVVQVLRDLPAQVVVRDEQPGQVGQATHLGRNCAGERVGVQPQLFQVAQPAQVRGYLAGSARLVL